MINKIFKKIINKYSNIFKFLFYLKYLFLIFFISSLIYLVIPKFFNYQEKQVYIKQYLDNNYNFKVKDIKKIQYNILPLPNLKLENVILDFHSSEFEIKVNNITIFPDVLKIYNFKNTKVKKLNLENSKIKLKAEKIITLFEKFSTQKNKININNFSIELYEEKKPIIFLSKINFSNYGYKKNIILGEVFNKRFKIKFANKKNKINFKLINTGIFGEINYLNDNSPKFRAGKFKGKILNSHVKFNFLIDEKKISIKDFIFRNKLLSYNSFGEIIFSPYLSINLKSKIKEINKDLFENLDFERLIENKNFLKRLNINQEIDFTSRRFSGNFIKNFNSKISLTYGRLVSNKVILLSAGKIDCHSEINLTEDNPILILRCFLSDTNVQKFLKKFSIEYDGKNEKLNLELKANLNLRQKKINFLNIRLNNNYQASEEDLKFYKNLFENIMLDKSIYGIFNTKKISKFLNEIL